ncbi:cobalt ECF transporter T component CbiQ [Mycolicibacterium neoaurum]|uniref:CbiQ family ECF transporter T component n=1 Tax=Mycolicibacterium neoaurum TaxID=1795 RepID=UPI00248B7ED7|nr:CbiQ family ECF transporter T component [Mycolicibacterium neoaurum]WBP92747.1 cobalt ECF transporter T component CbiQ [Mycolicibacterium neoaurum]WBS06309.1 cobalt ECF transporter T component CbiQ [Mycolicibacterium neoaurum]
MNPLELSAVQNRWAMRPAMEKVVLYGGLLLCAMLLPPRTGAPLIFVVTAVATLAAARVRARLFLMALAGPVLFIALGSLPIAIGLRGGVHVDTAGVSVAVDTALRSIAASAATIGLAVTTTMADLLELARRAGLPAQLCHVVDLTYRLVGILVHSARSAREAAGMRLGLHDARGAIAVVGGQAALVFVRAVERARSMSEAMSMRAEPGMTAVLIAPQPVRPARIAVIALTLTGICILALWSQRVLYA